MQLQVEGGQRLPVAHQKLEKGKDAESLREHGLMTP